MIKKLRDKAIKHIVKRWSPEQHIRFGRTSFSQEGEDVLLWRIMDKDHSPGVFVDVGANHPYQMSNTAFFYERGWTGVAIDPNPQFASDYGLLRPLDRFVNCGVAQNSGELRYFEFDEPLFNTFDPKKAESIGGHHAELIGTRDVPVRRLDEILADVWPDGQAIRFLSVDAEGMDLEVLRSHDFDRFPVDFACVELHGIRLSECRSDEAVEYLESLGYVSISKLCKSAILIHGDAASKWGLQI